MTAARVIFFAVLLFLLTPWASPPLALALGLLLGLTLGNPFVRQSKKLSRLRLQQTESVLISVGTSICGGSAIAAVGPIVGASDEQMSVSLGTVFILNSAALLTFPFIGTALHLDQTQFGLWAALAIHDTSSVV